MRHLKVLSVAAAVLCAAATSSSAITLDFDTGTPVFSGTNNLVGYSQDGLSFSISQTGPGSSGANLFNTLFCVNGSGGAAKCDGNDDGDLVPRNQGENGVEGNILIRQETPNRGNQNGDLDDDSARGGVITFTLTGGSSIVVRGFSAVDEQPMWIDVGSETCGPVNNPGNRDTGRVTCTNTLSSPIGVGESFDVRYAGSGGVDSIILRAMPLPAGMTLMLAGLGSLAFWRRRQKNLTV